MNPKKYHQSLAEDAKRKEDSQNSQSAGVHAGVNLELCLVLRPGCAG